jgi:threonyl-tRNA synthetase
VLTVSEKSEDYGREVLAQLQAAGLRARADLRSEKLGAKVREAQLEMIPYMLVVGPRDAEAGTVSLRDRTEGDLGAIPLADAIARLSDEVRQRCIRQKFQTGVDFSASGTQNEY